MFTFDNNTLDPVIQNVLEDIDSQVSGTFSVEHNPDGTHSNVTAESVTTDDLTVNNDLDVNGALNVDGATTLAGLTASGAVQMNSTLDVDGTATVDALNVGDGTDVISVTTTTIQSANAAGFDIKATFGTSSSVKVYGGNSLGATIEGSSNNYGSRITLPSADLIGSAPGPRIALGRNSDATTPAASTIMLTARDGTEYFLWVDATGDLRIHTSAPGSAASDTDGTVVGTQT